MGKIYTRESLQSEIDKNGAWVSLSLHGGSGLSSPAFDVVIFEDGIFWINPDGDGLRAQHGERGAVRFTESGLVVDNVKGSFMVVRLLDGLDWDEAQARGLIEARQRMLKTESESAREYRLETLKNAFKLRFD